MRWVVVAPGPDFSVADVWTGWVEGLRAVGQDVHPFDLADRLAFYSHAHVDLGAPDATGARVFRRALTADQAAELAINGLAAELWKIRPDVLLVVTGIIVPTELLDHARACGIVVVVHHTEQPYELARELGVAAHADLNLVNDPTHLAAFGALAPSVYVPQAWREGFHTPGPTPVAACDLAFVGTGFPSRRWFLEEMVAALADAGTLPDVVLAGGWQNVGPDSPLRPLLAHDPGDCAPNAEAVDLYRAARMGINLYRREAETPERATGWAIGPREVEMAAVGLPFLRDPRGEGDEMFPFLPRFTDPGDAAEQLAWWLRHDDARRDAGRRARAAVAARTFTRHATRLVSMLEPTGRNT